MAVASVMIRRAVETLDEGVTALSLMDDALGDTEWAERAAFTDSAEGHAVGSVKILLRLFGRNSENVAAAWRSQMATSLVWLGHRGSLEARKTATAALLGCAPASSGVPLAELARCGVLEMAVANASTGGAGAALEGAPFLEEEEGSVEERENLRVLSLQLLSRVAARGAHAELMAAGAGGLACRAMADACAASWGEGGGCSEPLVGAAVRLAAHLGASPATHAELLRGDAARWLFHTAHRSVAMHEPAPAAAALAHLLQPFRRAASLGEWGSEPVREGELLDVNYKSMGGWYASRVEQVNLESVSGKDLTSVDGELQWPTPGLRSVDVRYNCDGSTDTGVRPSQLFRYTLFRELPPHLRPEPEPEPEPEPGQLSLAMDGVRIGGPELSPDAEQLSPKPARLQQAIARCKLEQQLASEQDGTGPSRWLPSLPVPALRVLGSNLCTVFTNTNPSPQEDEAVILESAVRGVEAVAALDLASARAAGWLHHPHVGPGVLSPVLACLASTADPPLAPMPPSIVRSALRALLHLAIGDEKLEQALPEPVRRRARAPLEAARGRLCAALGASNKRVGGASPLYILSPHLFLVVLREMQSAQNVK